MKLPLVALCGRPNVGKSTLFNRLTRTRAALVHDLPGMTRDRSYGRVTLLDEAGDPTEVFGLVDTGGLDFDGSDVITLGITRIAEAAMQEAHVLVLMVDAHDGWNPDDAEIASRMRTQGKPALLVVNKIDGVRGGTPDSAFYELGFDEVHIISASHGDGVPELLESLQALLPFHRTPAEAELHDPGDELRFAVVGRPNVGKSSLVNKLLGYERSLVSDVAGTTRDTVDTVFQVEERVYRLIDTAGIRRKGKTNEGAEKLSILKAKQAMARADVSLLLVDAVEGVTHQDAVIAGYAHEAGAAVIIVVNKWDLVDKDTFTSLAMEDKIRQDLGFLHHAPMIFISALTGQRVTKLFALIHEVADAHARRVSTGKLNQFLRDAVSHFSPPSVDGKLPKLYFMTQVGVRPPSFVVKTNTDREIHFSYQRYLENRLRDDFGFVGTPIRLAFRKRGVGEGEEGTARVRRILDPGEGLKPSKGAASQAHSSRGPRGGTGRGASRAKRAAERGETPAEASRAAMAEAPGAEGPVAEGGSARSKADARPAGPKAEGRTVRSTSEGRTARSSSEGRAARSSSDGRPARSKPEGRPERSKPEGRSARPKAGPGSVGKARPAKARTGAPPKAGSARTAKRAVRQTSKKK